MPSSPTEFPVASEQAVTAGTWNIAFGWELPAQRGLEEKHMTYQNDPNRDFNRPAGRMDDPIEPRLIEAKQGWGTGSIVLASLAAFAIVFGLFYAIANRSDTSVANRNDNRPAVTTNSNVPPATRETTGSRAPSSAIPNNPNGTAPQKDTNQPAPAPAPSR
jgi:hypothetical protein